MPTVQMPRSRTIEEYRGRMRKIEARSRKIEERSRKIEEITFSLVHHLRAIFVTLGFQEIKGGWPVWRTAFGTRSCF